MEQKELIILIFIIVLVNTGLFITIAVLNPQTLGMHNVNPTAVPKEPQRRIVGGKRVPINLHPYIAGIIIKKHGDLNRDMLQCGCSIIAKNWVVTAAHCIVLMKESYDISKVYISSGNSNWNIGKKHDAVNWIYHTKYDNTTMSNDIALIKVKQPFSEKPIPIANAKYKYKPNQLLTVSGWGLLEADDTAYPEQLLRAVKVKIISQSDCKDMYAIDGSEITSAMFCAGYPEGGKDACQFDSGGPITDKNLLIGIVSWGKECAQPNQPGVYTRISLYEKWITQTAKKLGMPLRGAKFKSKP